MSDTPARPDPGGELPADVEAVIEAARVWAAAWDPDATHEQQLQTGFRLFDAIEELELRLERES